MNETGGRRPSVIMALAAGLVIVAVVVSSDRVLASAMAVTVVGVIIDVVDRP